MRKHVHHSAHSATARSRGYINRAFSVTTSRGAGDSQLPNGQYVVGRLGTVTDDDVPINAGREQYGKLLSRCPKGTNLTITGETDTYYAVMMIDRSIGFIAKDKVQLLDFQITADKPATASNYGANAGPIGQQMIQSAVQYLGVPYVWGGNTASGIDCSGFVKAIYASSGISLPRTADDQSHVGYDVPRADISQWQPGDRLYFMCHHSYIDHTAMYIGNGYFIHSSIGTAGVGVTRISSPYYWAHLVCVRRSQEMVGDAANAKVVSSTDSENGQQ